MLALPVLLFADPHTYYVQPIVSLKEIFGPHGYFEKANLVKARLCEQ